MAANNINKLVRMIGAYLDENPDLFDYAGYDDPRDVIVRLDETFSAKYWMDKSLCPEGIGTIHEALMKFLDKNWNAIDDRITAAGGNSFYNRDAMEYAFSKMTNPEYFRKRNCLIEHYPYLLDEISFEFCAESDETKHINISLDSDDLYVRSERGLRGMYIYKRGEQVMRYRILDKEGLSRKLNGLCIYKWPKAFPSDYVPEDHLMGCDTGSWSISYKEIGKKTSRHIHGKGPFPKSEPYLNLLQILNNVDPDHDLMEWVLSFS